MCPPDGADLPEIRLDFDVLNHAAHHVRGREPRPVSNGALLTWEAKQEHMCILSDCISEIFSQSKTLVRSFTSNFIANKLKSLIF